MSYTYAGQYGPETIDNLAGTPLRNFAVIIYNTGTTTPITLYTDRTKTTVLSSTGNTQTDTAGNLVFFAEPGRYDIVGNSTKLTVTVYPDVTELGIGGGGITQLTGDITAGPGSGSVATNLASLSPSPAGTYGTSSQIPVVTVDSKGRITSVTTVAPSGGPPTGSAGGADLTGSYPNPTLSPVYFSASPVGSATGIPVLTIGANGRVYYSTTVAPNDTTKLAIGAAAGGIGSDLVGTYPGPSLVPVGTAGVYGSATQIPVISTDAKGRVASVTTVAPSDTTKLPLAGGTMTGAIAMGSQRITGAATAQANTDAARADSVPGNVSPAIHGPIAWSYDITNSSNSLALTLGVEYFVAITIPYGFTPSNYHFAAPAANAGNCTAFVVGIYNTSGTLLTSATPTNYATQINTANLSVAKLAVNGSVTLTAGQTYMIGFIASGGTTGPTLYANSQSVAGLNNIGCPTPSAGKLDQRACQAGTGLTALANPMSATPTLTNRIFFVGLS